MSEEQIIYPSSNYNLPAGFKKCVYLQSDGTQWIDTGVIPDNETGLCFEALQLSYGDLISNGVAENGYTIYSPLFINKNLYYKWGSTRHNLMAWDKADDLIFHSSLNLYNSKIAKFDSEDTDVVSSIASQEGTYTLPIWLFSYNDNGSYNSTYGKWVGRIYRAQITQGDALIHDYVPCLDANGRPCMYDIIGGGTVEDNTYYNQSEGSEFVYCLEHQLPSDFIKLKYLESTGTQYIKTGHVPTNITGLYIDTQDVGSGDTYPMGLRESSSTNTRFYITRQTSAQSAAYGWGTWNQISTTKGSVRYDSTLNWLNDRKSITNNPLFSTIITNLGELPFTPSLDIWMFGINQGGSHAYNFKGRIYRAKISEGSEIVRDYVPAFDEVKLKPCMYDLINNIAYYNDGEGEFLTNRDFEGTYTGYSGLGCIGNRLGSDYNPVNEKLPSGYIKVEFLQGNGSSAYINSGIRLTDYGDNFGFKTTYLFPSPMETYALNSVVFGARLSSRVENMELSKYGGNMFRFGTEEIIMRGITDKIYNAVFKNLELKIYENSSLIKTWETTNNQGHSPRDIYLFAVNQGNPIYFSKTRIYKLNFFNGEESIRSYQPTLDKFGVPCMYDLVTGQPFYNSGTGQFIVGLKTLSHALQLYLPDSGGTIHLSLPTNDKIEYYEEKIRANNPNWEITFYYH